MMSRPWLIVGVGWLLPVASAAGQAVESPVSPAISTLALLGFTGLQLAAPLTAILFYRGRAPAGAWLLLIASAWLGFLVAVFASQQLVRNFSLLALLMIAATLVGATLVSLIAFRAAWRMPSFPLAVAIVVMSFGVPILARNLSLNPQFNVLWYRLNEGRLAHLDLLARTDLAAQLEHRRDVPLPPSLADLALGDFSKIGDCELGPVIYLPQFYPLIGGDWSDGFAALPCTDPGAVLHSDFPYGLELRQHVGGIWWFARY